MREIKYRAKRIDNGRWAYGHYVKTPITTEFNCEGQFLDSGIGRHCIIQEHCAHEIDFKTLGQYTGRKDKNKKEIYEGDICKTNKDYFVSEGKIEFENSAFLITTIHNSRSQFTMSLNQIFAYTDPKIEIIGDIHTRIIK